MTDEKNLSDHDEKRVISDLCKLAVDRCDAAIASVTQLAETPEHQLMIIAYVATSFASFLSGAMDAFYDNPPLTTSPREAINEAFDAFEEAKAKNEQGGERGNV